MMDFTGNIDKIYQFVQNACIVRINQADNIHYKVFDAFCLSRTLCISNICYFSNVCQDRCERYGFSCALR